jgi:hypothetical protein
MCGKCKLWSFKKIRLIETEIVEYVFFSPNKALLFIDRKQQNLHFYIGCVESTRYEVLRNSVPFEPEIRYMSYFALKVQFHQ